MSNTQEPPTLAAKEPDEDDLFYLEWARESLKGNITLLNEVLRQFVTLNTAVLGGSIAFLGENIISPSYKLASLLCFFLSLIICVYSLIPFEGKLDLYVPASIQEHKERAFSHKRRLLFVTALAFFLGIAIAAVGVFLKVEG